MQLDLNPKPYPYKALNQKFQTPQGTNPQARIPTPQTLDTAKETNPEPYLVWGLGLRVYKGSGLGRGSLTCQRHSPSVQVVHL